MPPEYLEDKALLLEFLKDIDTDFDPPLSVQEGSIENYADKIIKKGKILISHSRELEGILAYIRTGCEIQYDLLWIHPNYKGRFLPLLRTSCREESGFIGNVKAKINSNNHTMVSILNNMGFQHIDSIPNDYNSTRISHVYRISFERFKEYLRVSDC